MRYVILCAALAVTACSNKLDAYEEAAKRVRQVCTDNGNAVGSPAFNECFNTIWASSMAAEGRRGAPAPWPFPASAPVQPAPVQPVPPQASTSCQNFGGVVRCR